MLSAALPIAAPVCRDDVFGTQKALWILVQRVKYRLALTHAVAMNRHVQKDDHITQLEKQVERLKQQVADANANAQAKEMAGFKVNMELEICQEEIKRLSDQVQARTRADGGDVSERIASS